ncbi:MAG: hypothetical protein ACPG6V_06835 [Flavobacteriales bacterium]
MKLSLILASSLALHLVCYSQDKPTQINSGKLIEEYTELVDEFPENAIKKLDEIGMSDTNYFRSVHLKAVSSYASGNYSEAIEHCNEIIKFQIPKYLEYAYNVKGLSLNVDEKSQEALEVYKEANKVLPNKYLLEYNMGVVYESLEMYPEAIQKYQRTIELNPIYQPAYFQLGLMAANEGYLTLAFQNYVLGTIFHPGSLKAHKAVNYLDKLSENEAELKPKGISVELLGNDYSKIDKLIKNKIAISKKYKFKSKLKEFNTIKQLHLITEQLKNSKLKSNNRHVAFVDRVFKEVIPTVAFDDFAGAMFIEGSYSAKVDKVVNSNKSKIEDFQMKFFTALFDEYESIDIKFKNKDINTIVKRGEGMTYILGFGDQKDNVLIGEWTYFNNISQVKSTGSYTSDNEREGVWGFYNKGKIYEDANYVDGQLEGENNGYYQNGNLAYKVNYKNGKLDGLYEMFYINGQKKFEGTFVDGTLKGKATKYYSNGVIDEEYYMVDKKIDGDYISVYNNGKTYFKGQYKAGKLVGDVAYFHRNGNKNFTVTYNEKGKYDGVKKAYFWDGTLESEGTYENGKAVGLHKEYFRNGNLESEANYDIGGKKEGLFTSYYRTGEVKSKYVYKSGKLMSFIAFAKDGSELYNSGTKKGNFDVVFYNGFEQPRSEGTFKKGVREGLFKYYSDYGYVKTESECEDDEFSGKTKTFYFDGSLKSEGEYKDDERNGLFVYYGPKKEVKYSGYYKDDKGEGDWCYYYPDGEIKSITNFKDDKRFGFDRDFDRNGDLHHLRYESQNDIVNQYFLADGTMYHADTLFDKSGEKITRYTNGKIETKISFIDSKENGKFVSYFTNGKIETEYSYVNGLIEGELKGHYESGKLQRKLNYVDDKRVGDQFYYFENGQESSKEHYDNNGKITNEINYRADGTKKSTIEYKDGEKEGPSKFYIDDKLILVRNYVRGKLMSYTYLDANGKLKPEIPIVDGTCDLISYYQSGKKSTEMHIDKGSFEGNYFRYFEDGSVQYSANYYYNELEGESMTYSKPGVLLEKTNYKRGLKHGKCEYYDEDGNVERVVSYYYGNRYGDEVHYNADGTVKETKKYHHDIQLF